MKILLSSFAKKKEKLKSKLSKKFYIKDVTTVDLWLPILSISSYFFFFRRPYPDFLHHFEIIIEFVF